MIIYCKNSQLSLFPSANSFVFPAVCDILTGTKGVEEAKSKNYGLVGEKRQGFRFPFGEKLPSAASGLRPSVCVISHQSPSRGFVRQVEQPFFQLLFFTRFVLGFSVIRFPFRGENFICCINNHPLIEISSVSQAE